jgi:glycosyltransferase involved in cell wall biosynthesis
MKRVLAFVSKARGISPGQRFRIEQWAPYLESQHGIHVDFAVFESPKLTKALAGKGQIVKKGVLILRDFVRRALDVLAAKKYDAVFLYREASLLGPTFYEYVLKWQKIPLLVDFDDAIWIAGNWGNNGLFAHLRFPSKIATICRICDAVTVGNGYLRDFARRYNSNVAIIPTTIDLNQYAVQPELADDETFTVLWSGSTPTLVHFETAREALETLASRRKIVVKVICNKPPERPIAGAQNVFIPWSPTGEAEAIGACHVGIMPLPDDEFSRGKCGLKALQYMATGRAAVASPVGMNRDLIEHGVSGMLASTKDEWVAALETLADDPALRRRLGAEGRRTVERDFSATAGAQKLAAVIEDITGGRR